VVSRVARPAWHVTDWGLLGWLETAVKLLGMGAAAAAFAASTGPVGLGPDLRSLAVIVLGGLTLLSLAAIYLRFLAGEAIAFAFAVGNALAHMAALASLVHASPALGWLTIFGTCFVVGEIVKQYFLRTTGYTELGRSNETIIRMARRILSAYLALTLLTLIAR